MTQTVVQAKIAAGSAARDASYSDGMACRMCYVKHLAKAAIELAEYLEDDSRSMEFALFVGDLSCAGDHAMALGEETDASELRAIRRTAMESPTRFVCDKLRAMASEQARRLLKHGAARVVDRGGDPPAPDPRDPPESGSNG